MQDSVVSTVNLTWQDTAMTWQDTTVAIDTLPLVPPLPPLPPQPSLFEGHLLPPSARNLPAKPLTDTFGWLFLVLLGCIVLFTIAQRSSEGRPRTVLRAAFDRGLANQLARNDLGPGSTSVWIMLLAGILSLSLFLTLLLRHVVTTGHLLILDFLSVFGIMIGLGIVVRLSFVLLGALFNVANSARMHAFDRSLMVISCGFVLIPVCALYLYGPMVTGNAALVIGMVTIGLFYLKDAQRSIMLLWVQPAVNVAHIFYYICAFKILPLSVIIRLALAF
jgi:hypothetical protein